MEGSRYSRRFLYSSYGHRADQRGVNGNIQLGADSIVVSRQSLDHREEDGECGGREQSYKQIILGFWAAYEIVSS